MERPSIISKETLIPVGVAVSILTVLIGGAFFVARDYYSQDEFKKEVTSMSLRMDKIEANDQRQDTEIQDGRSFSAVITETLKNINEKLDDLKKSLDRLDSQAIKK